MRKIIIPTLLALITTASRGQLSVDFNSAGHLDLNFATAAESNLWSQSATGGLANGGAVAIPEVADNQFWTLSPSYAGNTDQTLSLYIHTTSVLNAGYISFGMAASSPQSGVVYPSGGDFLGVSINPANSEFELKGEGAFNVSGGTLDTVMVADSWYYLELALDWQFNQFYGMQFRAYASDANGNLGASLIDGTTFSAGLESDVADDSEVFAFFGGNNTGSVLTHIDQFSTSALSGVTLASAVPEPSAAAVLMGFAALGLGLTRRRLRV